jgi:hypothetical protein
MREVSFQPRSGEIKTMYTLCIRYTINPNKFANFKTYVKAEQDPIRRSGGIITGCGNSGEWSL